MLIAYGLSLLLISMVFHLPPDTYIGRGVLAWSSLTAVCGVLAIRVVFVRLTDFGLPKRRVLVLGNGAEAEEVIRYLHEGSLRSPVEFAGLYPAMSERNDDGRQRSNDHAELRRAMDEPKVSEIFVAVREIHGGVLPLRHHLDRKLHGIQVKDLQSFYERKNGILRVDTMCASWMMLGDGFGHGMTRDIVKRFFDVVVSIAPILLTTPILLVAMVVVESGPRSSISRSGSGRAVDDSTSSSCDRCARTPSRTASRAGPASATVALQVPAPSSGRLGSTNSRSSRTCFAAT